MKRTELLKIIDNANNYLDLFENASTLAEAERYLIRAEESLNIIRYLNVQSQFSDPKYDCIIQLSLDTDLARRKFNIANTDDTATNTQKILETARTLIETARTATNYLTAETQLKTAQLLLTTLTAVDVSRPDVEEQYNKITSILTESFNIILEIKSRVTEESTLTNQIEIRDKVEQLESYLITLQVMTIRNKTDEEIYTKTLNSAVEMLDEIDTGVV